MSTAEHPSANNVRKAGLFSFSRRCPACSSQHMRRSARKNWLEGFLSIFGWYPFRCRNYHCNHRFLRLSRPSKF